MSQKKDIKQETVTRITNEMVRDSGGRITHNQAQKVVRESAERINRERREKR